MLLSNLNVQDQVVISILLLALLSFIVCVPCYLLFVMVSGSGPRRVKSVCSHIARCRAGPKPFSFHEIEPKLFLGSLPRSMEHLEKLKAAGVGAVVTLNEPWELVLSCWFVREECGLALLHLPTPDFFAPSQDDIEAAVKFITQQISSGTGVYVHCNGGKGRSAVCVIAYLIREQAMTPPQAFEFVKTKRKIAKMRGKFGMHKQWRAIKQFARTSASIPKVQNGGLVSPVEDVKPSTETRARRDDRRIVPASPELDGPLVPPSGLHREAELLE